MIIAEIYAVQWEKRMEIKADEGIRAAELCRCIEKILGADGGGYLISCEERGVIPDEGRLNEYGVKTGSILLYI